MRKLIFNTAAAVLAVGYALATPTAIAGPTSVPLVNPTFNGPGGWTITDNFDSIPIIYGYADYNHNWSDALSASLGIHDSIFSQCMFTCKDPANITISQTVGSLVKGHQYEASVYAFDYAFNRDGVIITPGLFNLSLGNQTSTDFLPPSPTTQPRGIVPLWQKFTWDFTYDGNSGSADFSIIQRFSGLASSCTPCTGQAGYENLYLSNASLYDLAQGGGGGVSEPGTLGILALGLGALGLFYSRRRNDFA